MRPKTKYFFIDNGKGEMVKVKGKSEDRVKGEKGQKE
jgi:hypothetical protein